MTHAAAAVNDDGHSWNLSSRQKLEILLAIMLTLFLFALDQTVVGTALPKIITDLEGQSLYTWAVTIYLLTSTISGPIYGKLSDLYGRRPIFIWAVGLFLASSIFAGLCQEMWQFVLARALQGLGGGAVFPIALAVIADLYPPEERAKYGALFGAVFGLSSVLGPFLGGFIADQFGWPWIFFINVPLALISLVICWRLLPPVKNPEGGRNIDYIGAALFGGAIAPILIGLTNKQTLDWTDPWVGGAILIGLVVLVVFLVWETRAADPLVRLELFRNRNVAVSVLSMSLASFGFFGAIIFLPQWFQIVRGMSATESGINLLPLVFALIAGATLTGQIASRTGRYRIVIIAAMVILAVGLFLMTSLRADTEVSTVWIWMIFAGLGVGPSFAVFTALVQNSVAPRVVGVATASLTFVQQIGGTIGLTIAGTVLADSLSRELPNRMLANNIPPQFVDAFQSQGGGGNALSFTGTGDLGKRILDSLPPEAVPFVQPFIAQIVTSLQEAFALAIASTFWIGIAAAVIAAVFVLFVKDPDRAAARPEGAPPLAM
ncbi:MAG TPA: MDR family MFS transporter [Candidatus Limnocylindrales bacterium]|nr:MDR family MFS transporter [Candidatus Limnocylindrales bacterium]